MAMARSKAIEDLIAHFERKEREWEQAGKPCDIWETLTRKEMDVIAAEISRCRNDFVYAAQNYFWIVDKDTRTDRLFSMWDSQHVLWETMQHLRRNGRSRRVIVIKARQLGVSTFTEALIAHQLMFFRNSSCFVVSYDDGHAAELFGIMQHIYDKMPWWLRPACWSRKFETGLILDTPPDERSVRSGMNSRVRCKGATAVTGVGQGSSLTGVHLSEFADWNEDKAREIIEEDIENALVDSPDTFGVLESTAKGAGGYAHDLWLRMERLGEKANWYPLFLPWFFDQGRRVYSLPSGWTPQEKELRLRDLARRHWVRCDNPQCSRFYQRHFGGKQQLGEKCVFCGSGHFREYQISDEQLAWWEKRRVNAEGDESSLATLRQEQATTADEAFVVSGVKLFSEAALNYAESCVQQIIGFGMLDNHIRLHGVDAKTERCFQRGCNVNHEHEDPWIDFWELPQKGAQYVIGVDTADGLGGHHDYSVAQVLKVVPYGADEQVAVMASNTVDASTFAKIVYRLGMFYNKAMVSVELNSTSGGVVAHALRVQLQYPNLYRPLRTDTMTMESAVFGWKTTQASKNRLYQCTRRALEDRLLKIRDRFTVRELQYFRKDPSSGHRMGAIVGHDDRIMALMIAYTTAHERDWDETAGVLRSQVPLTLETARFHLRCRGCGRLTPLMDIVGVRRCPACQSMQIEFYENQSVISQDNVDSGEPVMHEAVYSPGPKDYISL